MILSQDQRLKDLDHRSKITEVIFYWSKDPDHINDLDLLAERSPIFPIYGLMHQLTSLTELCIHVAVLRYDPCSVTLMRFGVRHNNQCTLISLGKMGTEQGFSGEGR